jgi:hypothetical protein
MRFLSSFMKSLISLGALGLMMVLMAGLILYASFSQESEPFNTAQERMELLDTLEDGISVAMNDMQRAEAFSAFSLEYFGAVDAESIQTASDADAEISTLLEDLRAAGHFDPEHAYAEDITEELKRFDSLRSEHRKMFALIVNIYEAGNEEQWQTLLEQLQDDNQNLNDTLGLLVQFAERGRLVAMREFPEEVNSGILIATGSLTILLLLTLAGYLRVAAATRPLHQLSNAITAIGGDQYRPELLEGLIKLSGPAGNLARGLNQLAQHQQGQNAGLKIDIERLRQELYESRRRRLKLHIEVEGRGENQ